MDQPDTPSAATWYARRDSILCAVLFVVLCAFALLFNRSGFAIQNLQFGWEYGNTAVSLVEGRGYADPFDGIRSGATAWMPPLLVGWIALVFALFGVESTASLSVLLVAKYLGITLGLHWLLASARVSGWEKNRWLIGGFLLLAILANRSTFFLAYHDVWLILLLSCALLRSFVARWLSDSPSAHRGACALAVILPLSSPALSLAFVAIEATAFGLAALGRVPASARRAFALRRVGAVALFFVLATGVWTMRNQTALGTLLPSKSNLWFDFVQANEIDEDGVPSNRIFLAHNPSNPNPTQERFAQLGEAAFTEEYRGRARDLLLRAPGDIAVRILRRASNAFLYLRNPDDVRPIAASLDAGELEALHAEGLAMRDWLDQPVWISLDDDPARIESALRMLQLRDGAALWADWQTARAGTELDSRHWTLHGRSLALTLGPTLAILITLAGRRTRTNVLFLASLGLYLAYLAPYVMVSHYLRYQTPMVGIQAVFFFMAGSSLLARWRT